MADVNVKTLQTRIALKYDSYANWTNEDVAGQGANLVLLKGEIGVCEIPSGNANATTAPTVLFKVGDGVNTFKSLKWASALAADVHDWAKAETVVLDGTSIKFKTGDVVKHTIDLSDFATDAEVKAITDPLAARIEAVENKFKGDDSVQGQIDALDGRLDVIEGEGEGSVKKALADAKAYTDEREVEIKKYADQAEADANTYTDGKVEVIDAAIDAVEGRLDVIEGEGAGSIKKAVADAVTEVKAYADTAESDAVATAKGYTDTREAAIKAAYEAYADQAEADAKSYVDGKVSTINAKDEAQDTAIQTNADNLAQELLDRAAADKAITDSIGTVADGKTVVKMIEDAEAAAKSAAAEDAAAKVKALKEGEVATNASEIARVEGKVDAEVTARENADNAIIERLESVEAFFELEEGEKLDTALDTLKEIQDYLNGDGEAANSLIDRIAANETAIGNLEDRVDTAEDDIDALEAADEAIDARLDVIEGDGEGSIKKAQADAEAAAKSYTDGRETLIRSELKTAYEAYADKAEEDAVATAKGYTDGEVSKLSAKDTEIAGNVTTLQNIVDGYTDKGSIKSAVDAAQKAADDAQDAADAAQEAADKAQGEVDALEGVVATLRSEYDVTKALATTNEAAIEALDARVETAEGEIDVLQGIVNSGEGKTIRDDVTALQTLTGDASKGNEALRSELTTLQGIVNDETTGLAATKKIADQNKTDIGLLDGRVTAIESDYLKAADVYVFNCGSSTAVVHEQPKA